MVRVTFRGAALAGLAIEDPAASVRLLLPAPGTPANETLYETPELVIPTWNGNEFLLPDGRRPTIRTFTPRRLDRDPLELTLDLVVHELGAASRWAQTAALGDPAAISGPGRGYAIDQDAAAFLLAGDETAIPAISQLLEVLPAERPVQVFIEGPDDGARLDLPQHPRATVVWSTRVPDASPGDELVAAVRRGDVTAGTRVWAAGEAAVMQRIRRHLFEDRAFPRAHATVRGYWKQGRSGDAAGTGDA